MPTPEKHALLSASSAERWLHCTRAPRLEAELPESTSTYAEEGRLAHALGELKLLKKFTPLKPSEYTKRLKKLKADPLYTPEMEACTDAYLEFVTGVAMEYSAAPFVAVEARLDFSRVVPEGFGTGDCVVVGGDTLHIIDLKYGKGVPVAAEGNPQMRLYALGAVLGYGMFYDIRRVRMTIFQPRLDSVSTAEMTRDELLDWAVTEVKPRAALAHAGEGDFVPGDWCRFCRARGTCRARARENLALEEFQGTTLTDDEVGNILARAQGLKKWVEDLEAHALEAVLAGREIPGWKAVAGRSVRRWVDMEAAFKKLVDAGWGETLLYRREPITLADVEKLLGKAQFDELLGDQVTRPTGKPTLAPASDKREAYQKTSAGADFAGAEEVKQ